MKSKLILFVLVFISFQSFAQRGNFPEKYRSFFLGIGPRSLKTDVGTIVTSFTDESPSMDHIETTVDITDHYNKIGGQFGFKWGHYRGLAHSVLMDWSFGEHQGGSITYSIGYSMPYELGYGVFMIRPAFFLGFGNYGFDIGNIENNAGYIEINGKQFTDSALKVELYSQVGVYGPEVDFMWRFNDHFDAFINVNYDLSGDNNNPKVRFTTINDAEQSQTSIDLDYENLDIKYNDKELTNLPYKISGLRLSVGVSFVWSKD